MADRILTADAAQTLQDDSYRDRDLLTWVVTRDEGSGEAVARPVAAGRGALSLILVAGTLAELRSMMPTGLAVSERQPADPPGLVEIWMTTGA
jgi:hypothetical protein